MRSVTAFAIATIALTAVRCPIDRTAERTLRGSPSDVPPAMRVAAPPALSVITQLRGPESVLHDPEQDVYFITNINGGLLERDGDGFISRVDAKSMAVMLRWVESGRNGVQLDAPKGMAIVGDTLYVSDITAVRKFDRRSGSPLGEIALPGATLINDITTDGTNLFVSDTGLRPGPGASFYATGTDAIWKITADRAEKYASTTALHHPNGLDVVDGKLRAVTFGGTELYEIAEGKQKTLAKLPEGQLDGLIHLADGTPLVSSWEGEGVYRRTRGDEFEPLLTGIASPADIGFDAKRKRLLVPRSAGNQVTIHAID